jgi:thioredoxin reductase (NADPH)
MENYDLLIIGGGPIGLACAIAAAKENLSYLIIEKGCLANSLFHYPVNMTFFSTAERLEIGGIPFMSLNPKPHRAEAVEYYRNVAKKFQLKINLYEKVIGVNEENDFYKIKTSKNIYSAKNIVIATGFYDIPNYIKVQGENLAKVKHYYNDPHEYAFQKTIVVGASNSAVDAALETFRKNAEVTMVIRDSCISDHVKYWVKPDIENRIKEGSIKAFFNSTIQSISEKEVEIKTPEGLIKIENDFVLILTGYRPDFDFLKKIGLTFSQDEKMTPSHNPETMETNRENIYLAGVVCGGMDTHLWFIENSRIHAELIVNSIIQKSKS